MERASGTYSLIAALLVFVPGFPGAQVLPSHTNALEVRVKLTGRHTGKHSAAAVAWLKPLAVPQPISAVRPGHFTILQKNRMFSPHLSVIPVGSTVTFPNADPFFHNVFSLFNGKRFDLGLYEAGSSKDVLFSREGVSYIFCNIHPEMSAVVVALSTPYYVLESKDGMFHFRDVPEGDFELHVWMENLTQSSLEKLTRPVHIRTGMVNSVELEATGSSTDPAGHLNKFGQPYKLDASPMY